jgi:hypothetical protein
VTVAAGLSSRGSRHRTLSYQPAVPPHSKDNDASRSTISSAALIADMLCLNCRSLILISDQVSPSVTEPQRWAAAGASECIAAATVKVSWLSAFGGLRVLPGLRETYGEVARRPGVGGFPEHPPQTGKSVLAECSSLGVLPGMRQVYGEVVCPPVGN